MKTHRQPRTRRVQRHARRRVFFEQLEQRLLLVTDWTNPFSSFDVDRDGHFSPIDALVGINELNSPKLIGSDRSLPDRAGHEELPFYDVNGDGFLSPVDVLIVFNALNGGFVAPPIEVSLATDTAPGGETNDDFLTSDPTVFGRIVGKSTESSKLTAQVDGGARVDVEFENDGSFLFSTPLALDNSADGEHTVRITALRGELIVNAREIIFTLDTLAPGIPSEVTLNSTSDTGISDSDRITNDNTPTISGTAESNTIVHLLADNQTVGQGSSSETWQITSAILQDGGRAITAKAEDLAGNISSASAPLSLTIDTVAPTSPGGIALTVESDSGASSTDGVTNVKDPTVRGDAEEGALVRLFADGQEAGQATANSPWQITLNELADGTYAFTADAEDAAGNLSDTSATHVVTIDTLKPEPPRNLSLTPASDSGFSNVDGITNSTEPWIQGDAEAETVVTLALGSQTLGSAVSDGRWQVSPGTLSDGLHAFTATTTDLAGNVSDISNEFTATVDTISPVARVDLTGTFRQTFSDFNVVFDDVNDISPDASNPANYSLTIVGGVNDGEAITLESVRQQTAGTVDIRLAEPLADQTYRLQLDANLGDVAGNSFSGATTYDFTIADPTGIREVSPANGEQQVRLHRELKVYLDEPIDPSTVSVNSFHAMAKGEQLAGTIRVSSDERSISLFLDQLLPASSRVRLSIDGDQIIGRDGFALDANIDNEPGGLRTVEFATGANTSIANTSVFGYIYDSHGRNPDGSDVPVIGATVTVEGPPDLTATTGEDGFFQLDNVPYPEFYVDINGMTATNAPEGMFFGRVTKPFHSVAGHTTQLNMAGVPFSIFLPQIAISDVAPIVPGAMTMAGFNENSLDQLAQITPDVARSEWEKLEVQIPPDSVFFDDGTMATQVRVFPLDRERIHGKRTLSLL
ncbi:MAG: Ig-like domain-containing protein [Planctomycetota bacterium]|nr:Ig-like domain-containing protein [Planctomycetota bacterium]